MEVRVPNVLREGFDAVVRRLEEAAQANAEGTVSIERVGDLPPAHYLARFEPAVRERHVDRVVLVSDDLDEELLTPEFVDLLRDRLEGGEGFTFIAFVGLVSSEMDNAGLTALKEAATRAPGQVTITELGMKPLLQGLFTNVGGICRGLEQTAESISRVVLFSGVDLTREVAEIARSYLRYEATDGPNDALNEDRRPSPGGKEPAG
ncbi:MAG: hypothetical protein ACLFRR_06485 [Spirochaetaceae bacterium]